MKRVAMVSNGYYRKIAELLAYHKYETFERYVKSNIIACPHLSSLQQLLWNYLYNKSSMEHINVYL